MVDVAQLVICVRSSCVGGLFYNRCLPHM